MVWENLSYKSYLGNPILENLSGKTYLGKPIWEILSGQTYLVNPILENLSGKSYLGKPIWENLSCKSKSYLGNPILENLNGKTKQVVAGNSSHFSVWVLPTFPTKIRSLLYWKTEIKWHFSQWKIWILWDLGIVGKKRDH